VAADFIRHAKLNRNEWHGGYNPPPRLEGSEPRYRPFLPEDREDFPEIRAVGAA